MKPLNILIALLLCFPLYWSTDFAINAYEFHKAAEAKKEADKLQIYPCKVADSNIKMWCTRKILKSQ